MSNEIMLERDKSIATVKFNRPEQRNAINYEGWVELKRVATELEHDDATRVVVFTGVGEQAFSAGADVKDFETHRNNSKTAKIYATALDEAMDAIESLSKPTISLITGFCVGGGCELSLATDLRIAADNAQFGIPVARLGILVGYKEMRRLVALVGPGNAAFILLTARLLDADHALRIGLVNEVLPLADVHAYTAQLAHDMSRLAPLSQGRHKEILQISLQNPSLSPLTRAQKHLPFSNFDSADFIEGRNAFLEHRSPQFKGT